MNQAVSINGQPYTALPNAFKFRTEFNPSCACKAAGQTWSDALKTIDDKAAAEQQGDIIVTEESAKKMARAAGGEAAPAAAKKGARRRAPRPPRLRLQPPQRRTAPATARAAADRQVDPLGRARPSSRAETVPLRICS